MKKRYLILGCFGFFLVVAVVLRWPRLDPELASVTRSEVRGDEMVVEYRMTRPFEIALKHGIRQPMKRLDEPGIHFRISARLREEKTEIIHSGYDLLRGEHYVRLSFLRGSSLTVDANGQHLELADWSSSGAHGVTWLPPNERVQMGENVGKDILHFAESAECEEYLILYAGTDVRHLVE
ncbi:MAG TPA: hypothetical protein VMG10_33015 [Gemmataceae bacterium]|nr:hypothetical protein [Gemmataceae bacterium]